MTQDIESMYLHEIIIFGQVVGPRLQVGGWSTGALNRLSLGQRQLTQNSFCLQLSWSLADDAEDYAVHGTFCTAACLLVLSCHKSALWALTDLSTSGDPLVPGISGHPWSNSESSKPGASHQPVGLPAGEGGRGSGARDPGQAGAHRDRAGYQVAVPDQAEAAAPHLPGGDAGRAELEEDEGAFARWRGESLGGHLIITSQREKEYIMLMQFIGENYNICYK